MKQLVSISLIIFFIGIIIVFSQTAVNPEDFNGEWYSSIDQSVYLFQDGLISCSRHAVPISDVAYISGAYAYCKNSILVFAMGIDDLETEKVLYLVQRDGGSFLCEHKNGTGEIYFMRYSN